MMMNHFLLSGKYSYQPSALSFQFYIAAISRQHSAFTSAKPESAV